MAEYLADRIISGALEYCYVTGKRPDLKAAVDAALTAKGHPEMIKQTALLLKINVALR